MVDTYDLIVVGSGFAGSMEMFNFFKTCQKLNRNGRIALIEAGKSDDRCSVLRLKIAYLRLDRDLAFDKLGRME